MEVNLMIAPAPAPAADVRPTPEGPTFDEFLAQEPAPKPEAPERETRNDDDRSSRDERSTNKKTDETAGAQSARGETEARPDRTKEAQPADARDAARQAAQKAMQAAVKAEVTVNLEAPPAPEPLPPALTQSSLADRLARALMTQHGAIEGEATPGGLTDTVQLGAMLNPTDDGVLELTGWTTKSSTSETPAPVLRPVTLLATNPSGTRAGEAVTTRLPAGVDESSIMRQITDGMKLRLGKKQTAEIQLHPAELGRVSVKLQMEAGIARIFIGAEHAAVADLLSSHLDQLRQELSAQGVQVEHFEVSYHGDDAGDGEGEEGDAQSDPGATPNKDTGGAPNKDAGVSRRRHDGRISVTA